MKIVIFGLTVSSSWGNGHATIWRALGRVLAEHGHKIIFFERDVPFYARNRDLTVVPGIDLRLYGNWEDVRHQAQKELTDAEVGLVTSYCPDAIGASEIVLSSDNALHVFYDMDTPVTLAALEAGQQVAYIGPRGLADFDVVLSFTGGKALELLKEKLGAKEARPLYGCADPMVYRPVAPEAQFASSMSYLGTYAQDRQEAFEALFIETARHKPQLRFMLGGAMYPPDIAWPANVIRFEHIAPDKHPAFYSSSFFTLNITRGAMARLGYCPSGRLFEAAACGTPLISDEWKGLDQFFARGSEIVIAKNREEVIDAMQMNHYERDKIATAARERTLAEHSAGARVREFENILGSYLATIH